MRGPVLFGGLALALVACAPEADEKLGRTLQAIVKGSPSPTSQDATVLMSDRAGALCSGTLIAPNLILTARHCVSNYEVGSACGTIINDLPATGLTISTGADANERTVVARGVNVYVPSAKSLCGADIALLSLDKDVANITPAKVRFATPSESSMGTAVGYGSRSRTTRADVKILAVGPKDYSYQSRDGETFQMDPRVNEIVTSESTCFGDSGGPLLDAEGRIFAIASRGIDRVCADRPAFWTTLEGYEDLIRGAAAAVGHPLADAAPPPSGGNTAVAPNDDLGSPKDDSSPATRGGSKKKASTDASEPALSGAGCTAAPASPRSSFHTLLGIAIAVAMLRRRSSARPASPR